MPITFEHGEATSHVQGSFRKPKVLLMREDPLDVAMRSKLLIFPGCTVETCSNFLELLLHLEREPFQLVILLEGETLTRGWRTSAEFIAEANQDTPFFVINRNGEATGLSPSAGSLN